MNVASSATGCLLAVLTSAAVLPAQDGGYALADAFPEQRPFQRPLAMVRTDADPKFFYVVEQVGRVQRVPADPKAKERTVALDLRAKVYHGHNEEGLLGFAFDPAFATNRHVYVNYSESVARRTRQTVVARMTAVVDDDGVRIDPATELRVLVIPQPYGNHNGGCITFGPDGFLYIGMGDGGAADDPHGHGQDLTTLHGAILRVDVRAATAEKPYAIPKDNPFADGADGARKEIYAYGLRNVWGMTFDRATGDLWVGDVGQNKWEEVDRIVKGGNYGWNLKEGTHAFTGGKRSPARDDLIEPIAEYSHAEGLSVTGGYVYRGRAHAALVGRYVYGDYVTGRIWSVKEDRDGGEHDVQPLMRVQQPIAQFAEDADGELFVVSHAGRVYRIVGK